MTHTKLHVALILAVMTLVVAAAPFARASVIAGAESPVHEEDCNGSPDLASREACYARLPASVIEECESVRLFACAPYRDMHFAREAHATALEGLAKASIAVSDAYADSDPAYAGEFADRLRDAERAWEAWRDAECALAPLLDGMSRREFDGLTEACRAEQTRVRVSQLQDRANSLEQPVR